MSRHCRRIPLPEIDTPPKRRVIPGEPRPAARELDATGEAGQIDPVDRFERRTPRA
jgi:hypothetical protein